MTWRSPKANVERHKNLVEVRGHQQKRVPGCNHIFDEVSIIQSLSEQ